MKNITKLLLLNPETYTDDFLIKSGLGSPKNGYISEESRKKARLKRKKRK